MAQYFTQQNSYHVIMEILPELQGDPANLDKIYIRSPTTGATGAARRPSRIGRRRDTKPLSISHQGQFPAVTISFNLAPGRGAWHGDGCDRKAKRELNLPPSVLTTFQGNAQAFQQSLSTVPMLIGAALVVVYLILGILYESYIHPITILSTLPSAGAGALST